MPDCGVEVIFFTTTHSSFTLSHHFSLSTLCSLQGWYKGSRYSILNTLNTVNFKSTTELTVTALFYLTTNLKAPFRVHLKHTITLTRPLSCMNAATFMLSETAQTIPTLQHTEYIFAGIRERSASNKIICSPKANDPVPATFPRHTSAEQRPSFRHEQVHGAA